MQLDGREVEKFWARVNKTDTCWLWTGGKFLSGYGSFHPSKSKQFLAHRVSYLLTHGKLPEKGLVLDHLCEVRACVNPAHLEQTTIFLNASRSEKFKSVLRSHKKELCKRGHDMSITRTIIDSARCGVCRKAWQKNWDKNRPPRRHKASKVI